MNPRRELKTQYRPPTGRSTADQATKPTRKALPAPDPEPETDQPDKAPNRPAERPARKPCPDHRLPAATKLEPSEMAKLDRIAAWLNRVDSNRSAALRWLIQDFDESRIN